MDDLPPRRLFMLDALRGAAALIVLIHHAGPMMGAHTILPRGYLAVDFFFMLSGFVMSRAYEHRFVTGLGSAPFMAARIRRLYPTIAAGIVLGAVACTMEGVAVAATIGLLVSELLFLPALGGGSLGIYRLDGVQWSLLFELIANATHGLVLRRMSRGALTVTAAFLLGWLIVVAWQHGSLAVGDRATTAAAGLPRVLYPYVIGILLGRFRHLPPALVAWLRHLSAMLLPAMLLVTAGLFPARGIEWEFDVATVTFAFPILILWGARLHLAGAGARWAEAVGNLSYPLYAVHIPALHIALVGLGPVLGKGYPLLTIGIAAAVIVSRGVQHALASLNALPPLAGRLRDLPHRRRSVGGAADPGWPSLPHIR